jgi:hypothetical protein
VNRTESFRQALKSQLQPIVDNPKEIRGEGWPLSIYGDAMETLRQYPHIEI